MLDPVALRSFLAVVNTGGFSAAARALGLGQSTVSAHVARLESAVGRTLLLRDTHRVELTADGTAMAGFARSILDEHERALRYFADEGLTGRIRLGLSEDLVAQKIPSILRQFRADHPRVDLELTIGLSENLHTSLQAGALDLVFGKRAPGQRHGHMVFTDHLVWAGGPEEVIVPGEPVPLVTYPEPSLSRRAALSALDRGGLGHRITCVSDNQQGLRAAVQAGLGVMVHARSLLPADVREVHGLPDPGRIEFVLMTRSRPPTRVESALVEVLQTMAW